MSEVYQGHNRGGLINYVIIDDLKQLEIWGPRFELTNFVELNEYLNVDLLPFLTVMEVAAHRRERVMFMPKDLERNTTFYTVVDWQNYRSVDPLERSPLERSMIDASIPGVMMFIPTKVLLLTDGEVQTLRDHTGAQAKFLSDILHKEGFTGRYRLIAGAEQMSDKGYQECSAEAQAAFAAKRGDTF